jgi:uncharacterized protein (DUF4415 family)
MGQKKGAIMAMTKIIVTDGQKPTKEQIREVKAAAQAPITYTPDCPKSTPAALVEFAKKARELRRTMKKIHPSVTIRIAPDCLEKYKALGKGYTGIMADVLSYAADNPEFLSRVIR